MKSETFFCPHCGRQLTKSAAAWVLGETQRGLVLGEPAASVTCPACGRAIDSAAMIAGEYDRPARGPYAWLGTVVSVLLVALLLYYCTR